MYVRDPFNEERALDALETLARQQDPSSPELGALELSARALLFIFAVRPPEGESAAEVSPRTMLLTWSSQGHIFVAALAPWIEEVRERGTDEQRAFLRELGLDGAQEEDVGSSCSVGDEEHEARPGHDVETRPIAKMLPEPAHAITVLEALARRSASSTADCTCLELAVRALRFLIDTNQVDAFCAELDEDGRPHSPTGELGRPVAG